MVANGIQTHAWPVILWFQFRGMHHSATPFLICLMPLKQYISQFTFLLFLWRTRTRPLSIIRNCKFFSNKKIHFMDLRHITLCQWEVNSISDLPKPVSFPNLGKLPVSMTAWGRRRNDPYLLHPPPGACQSATGNLSLCQQLTLWKEKTFSI